MAIFFSEDRCGGTSAKECDGNIQRARSRYDIYDILHIRYCIRSTVHVHISSTAHCTYTVLVVSEHKSIYWTQFKQHAVRPLAKYTNVLEATIHY